jgi:murein DD-endopeptidase MepM/ murein hydrolase activator NlpD
MSESIRDFDDAEVLSAESQKRDNLKLPSAIRSCMVGAAVMAVLNGCVVEELGEELGEEESVVEMGTLNQPLTRKDGLAVKKNYMLGLKLNKYAGRRYTVCLNPTEGNPDLYGNPSGVPTINNPQYKSINSGSTSDCFSFNSSSDGAYYLGVYGNTVGSSGYARGDVWVTESNQQEVPAGFKGALTWPLPGYIALADDKFGDFNTSWGNAANNPFYKGDENFVHSGVDIGVPKDTPVKAVCDGKVTWKGDKNDGGNLTVDPKFVWGYYVVQECTGNGTTISVAYDHLNQKSRPLQNSILRAGQIVGTTFDLSGIDGEKQHLHLAICKGTMVSCSPQKGALKNTDFPLSSYINPWIKTNPGIWKSN